MHHSGISCRGNANARLFRRCEERKRRRVRRSSKSEGGSNPDYIRGDSLDCFVEPVIGPRFARTRWLAMTTWLFDM